MRVQSGTEWISDPGRFDELASSWNELARADSAPFGFHGWFSAWRAFGPTRRLAVCALWQDGDLKAAFPLWRRKGAIEAMSNALFTPVFAPLAVDEAWRERVIAEALGDRAGTFLVESVPEGPCLDAFEREAERAGRLTFARRHFTSPFVDTSGDFEAYREKMRTRERFRRVESRRRKLEREHEVRYALLEPPEDLERELTEGMKVEASGWKGRDGTAVLSSPATRDFHYSMASAYRDVGLLAMSKVYIDDQLVAFDLCVDDGKRAYLLKTGYDERFRRLAPGLVMRYLVVEHCFNADYQSHELLGAEADWKLLFATGERHRAQFAACRKRPLPALHLGYRRARAAAKPMYLRAPRPAFVRRRWG